MSGKSKASVKAMALLREELLKWLCIKHATNSPLSRAILKDTVFDFIRMMGLEGNFKCSESWVTFFLKRHGFSPALDSGVGPKMDDWSKWVDLVRGLINQYSVADQYHLDELTLYTDFANDTPPASSSMQQMTVLLACNAAGTDKLKPLICGASAVRESDDFTYARSCVLTDESLASWLQTLNTRLMESGRSILLFLSRTRINVVKLSNLTHILLVFYPLELPASAKPLRRDIFNFVKMEYRKAYVERLIDVRNYRWTLQEVVQALADAWKRLPQHLIIFRFSKTRYRIDDTMLAPSCPDFDRLELGVPFTTFITFDDHLSDHDLQTPSHDPRFLVRLKRHHSQLKLRPETSQADEEPAAGSSGQNGGTDTEPVIRVIKTQDGVEGRLFITNSMAGTSVVAGEPQGNGIQENPSEEPSGSGFQQNFTGENVNSGLGGIIPLHNDTNHPGEDSDVVMGEATAGEGSSSESTMTAPAEYSEENSAGKSLENVSQEQIPDSTSEERCQIDLDETPGENMSISEAGSEIPGFSTIPVLENNAGGEIPGTLKSIPSENSGVGLNENSSLENNCPGNSPARVVHSPSLFSSYFTSSTPGDQKIAPKHRSTPFPTRISDFSLNSEENNLENDPPANRRLFSPGKSDSDMENSRNTSLIIDEVNVTSTDEIPQEITGEEKPEGFSSNWKLEFGAKSGFFVRKQRRVHFKDDDEQVDGKSASDFDGSPGENSPAPGGSNFISENSKKMDAVVPEENQQIDKLEDHLQGDLSSRTVAPPVVENLEVEKSIVIPSAEVIQEIPASAVEMCVKTSESPGENENSSEENSSFPEEKSENSVENPEENVDCYEDRSEIAPTEILEDNEEAVDFQRENEEYSEYSEITTTEIIVDDETDSDGMTDEEPLPEDSKDGIILQENQFSFQSPMSTVKSEDLGEQLPPAVVKRERDSVNTPSPGIPTVFSKQFTFSSEENVIFVEKSVKVCEKLVKMVENPTKRELLEAPDDLEKKTTGEIRTSEGDDDSGIELGKIVKKIKVDLENEVSSTAGSSRRTGHSAEDTVGNLSRYDKESREFEEKCVNSYTGAVIFAGLIHHSLSFSEENARDEENLPLEVPEEIKEKNKGFSGFEFEETTNSKFSEGKQLSSSENPRTPIKIDFQAMMDENESTRGFFAVIKDEKPENLQSEENGKEFMENQRVGEIIPKEEISTGTVDLHGNVELNRSTHVLPVKTCSPANLSVTSEVQSTEFPLVLPEGNGVKGLPSNSSIERGLSPFFGFTNEHFDEKLLKKFPVEETRRKTFDSPSDNDESSLKSILMLKPKKLNEESPGKSSPAKLNEEPDEKSPASSPEDEDVETVGSTPEKRVFSPIFGLEDKQSSGELDKYSPETAIDSLEAPSNLPEIEGSQAEQVFSSIFAEKSQRLDDSAASTPILVRETAFQEASRELEEKLTDLEANDPDRRFPGDYDDDGSTAETIDTDSLLKDLLSETESPEFRGFPEDRKEQCFKGSKRLRVDDESEIGDRKRMKFKNSNDQLDNYHNFGAEQNGGAAAQKRCEENESSEPAAGCSYNKY